MNSLSSPVAGVGVFLQRLMFFYNMWCIRVECHMQANYCFLQGLIRCPGVSSSHWPEEVRAVMASLWQHGAPPCLVDVPALLGTSAFCTNVLCGS